MLRAIPGEQRRHHALLSFGPILSRPCHLPPLPVSSKTHQHRISHHYLRLPSTHRASTPCTGPRRARAAGKTHASSRSLAHCLTRSTDALYDSQTPTRGARIVWCANEGPQPGAIFFFIFVLFVFRFIHFYSILVPCFSSQNVRTVLIQNYKFL